jgi:hypothetical protein
MFMWAAVVEFGDAGLRWESLAGKPQGEKKNMQFTSIVGFMDTVLGFLGCSWGARVDNGTGKAN